MKRFTRLVCLLLAMSLLFAVPVFAAEEEEASTWSSSYFLSFSTYLYKTSSTKFQVWFDVEARRGMDELGASKIIVQRSSDGTSWSNMFTYYPTYYSQMICENTSAHAGYVPYTGTTGYYYRAKVTYYAKDSSGTAEYVQYTSKILL